jgi:hypothetical protein
MEEDGWFRSITTEPITQLYKRHWTMAMIAPFFLPTTSSIMAAMDRKTYAIWCACYIFGWFLVETTVFALIPRQRMAMDWAMMQANQTHVLLPISM